MKKILLVLLMILIFITGALTAKAYGGMRLHIYRVDDPKKNIDNTVSVEGEVVGFSCTRESDSMGGEINCYVLTK